MELLGISLPLKEIRKGIPLVSFACRDGENDAVLVKALPLPEADAWLERAAAGEVLYRVDYLSKGKPSYETGILPDRDGGTFLERLEEAVKDRDTKAGRGTFCNFLKMHLAFCGLEELAEHGLSSAGRPGDWEGNGSSWQADAVYYGEVHSYVKRGRELLNTFPFGEAVLRLPPFPDKAEFMRMWCGEGNRRKERKDEN